ncbi:MAG: hypothetical protein AAF393_16760, partial [Pseudomonadota bacterium]
MDKLPIADEASQEAFAAILRSNPVSTFVTKPNASDGQFEQFFLVTDVTLADPGEGLSIELGSEQLTITDFSNRLSTLVDAFNPDHRRLIFLRVNDAEDILPVSMSELQSAVGAAGFDVAVVMVGDITADAQCGNDASRAIHYPLITGVADRAPFGDGNGVSTIAEVDDFLRSALHRVTVRDGGCGPRYSMIWKSGEDDSQPLVSHDGLPSFTKLETRLYQETFEALFLMESTDQGQLRAFLDDCVYCPNEEELTERLKSMRQFELSSQLEKDIWQQISADDNPVRLEIYLKNCTLCTYRSDAEERIAVMRAKDAARDEEAQAYEEAAASRDLAALRNYVETCVDCARKDEATQLVADIESDEIYQAEREVVELAKANRDVGQMRAYLADCTICFAKDEVLEMLEVEKRRVAVSQPCFAAAGLPQLGGPRKLTEIDQNAARNICKVALDEFPEDPALKTILGRIEHAAGNMDAAQAAYDYGVEKDVAVAYGLAAYTRYAPADTESVDLAAVEKLASKGAERGDWLSQELLTVLYSKELVAGKNAQDAFSIAIGLAREDNALAQFFVGYFYMTGSGVEPSDEAAITWLDRSVRQGYLHAFSFLAEL